MHDLCGWGFSAPLWQASDRGAGSRYFWTPLRTISDRDSDRDSGRATGRDSDRGSGRDSDRDFGRDLTGELTRAIMVPPTPGKSKQLSCFVVLGL